MLEKASLSSHLNKKRIAQRSDGLGRGIITYPPRMGYYSRKDLDITTVVSRDEMGANERHHQSVGPFAFITISEAMKFLG